MLFFEQIAYIPKRGVHVASGFKDKFSFVVDDCEDVSPNNAVISINANPPTTETELNESSKSVWMTVEGRLLSLS